MARHTIKTALELKALVAKAVEEAAARNTRIRINDGDGLRLEVTPAGSTSWQLMYRMPGRSDRPYTIGKYPALSLKLVRELADGVREKVARGVDPNEEKKVLRQGEAAQAVQGDSVEKILEAFLETREREGYAMRSLTTMRRSFDFDVVPEIGKQVAKTVTVDQVEKILRKVEARNSHETRKRLASWLGRAFSEAQIKPNPVKAVDMDTFKRPIKSKVGHPGVTDLKVFAQVLRTIDAFKGSPLSRAALLIHARCFIRPDELRLADWSQVRGDLFSAKVVLEEGTFEHLVPLAPQARALFDEIRPIHKTFILPGVRYGQRMSDSTLGRILHALGWKDVQTVHGFRKSASTLLNEMGWDSRHVDLQLSHNLKAKGTEAVYNKARYLPQREVMMRCWSDYIDALLDPASGADDVLPLTWANKWRKANAQAA